MSWKRLCAAVMCTLLAAFCSACLPEEKTEYDIIQGMIENLDWFNSHPHNFYCCNNFVDCSLGETSFVDMEKKSRNEDRAVKKKFGAELIPNELGEYKTSSAVSVIQDGTVLVGAAAKERLVSYPESTAAFKALTLGTRRFKPEELSAFVLRQLLEDARRYLNEPVEEAVISVPAYFNDDQRCATKLAAQLAGLTVKRLINEPSAAALLHPERGQPVMIVDFGGGTLDVSIVDCFHCRCGAPQMALPPSR